MQLPIEFRDPMDYSDGRTKQAFKDSTDINKLIARVAAGDTITHLAKHGAIYGDFTDIDDLLTGMTRLKKGEQIFADLPGEIRKEFDQDVGKFFNFVNDPANKDRLEAVLPALAQPGDQLQSMTRTPANIESDPTVVANPEPPAPPPPPPPAAEPPPPTPPAG